DGGRNTRSADKSSTVPSRERKRDWGEHAQLALLYVHLLHAMLRSLAALVTVKGNFSLCYRAMRWIDADELMGFFPESYWVPF
ncbi:unnamed protein product, partial [Musa acuminata var. zebrina]